MTISGDRSSLKEMPFKSTGRLSNYFKRIDDLREDFFRQAKELKNHTVEKANFVPFSQYFPNYQDMDESQLNWYLYWRSEIRKENFLDNDTYRY